MNYQLMETAFSYSSFYSSMNQSGDMNNNISCQFVICESCFWTATVFNLNKKWDKNSPRRTTVNTCPMCSSKNISIISISTHDDDDVCRLKT